MGFWLGFVLGCLTPIVVTVAVALVLSHTIDFGDWEK
jgi:hypothetical protein